MSLKARLGLISTGTVVALVVSALEAAAIRF